MTDVEIAQRVAVLEAQNDIMFVRQEQILTDLKHIRSIMDRQGGTWKFWLVVAGLGGAIGAAIDRIIMMFK